MTIQDLCKEEKERQSKTLKDIADDSGLSINTVTNFFSSASKQPSIYTVAPICKALGVSLDSHYGIAPKERELQNKIDQLRIDMKEGKELSQKEMHDLEIENVRLTERNRMIVQSQQRDHHIVRVQSVFIAVLVVALLAYLVIDANIRTEGLIVHGQLSVIAVILIALAVISAVAVIISNIRVVKNKHND